MKDLLAVELFNVLGKMVASGFTKVLRAILAIGILFLIHMIHQW